MTDLPPDATASPAGASSKRSARSRDIARRLNHALRGDIHAVNMALSVARQQIGPLLGASSARDPFARLEAAIAALERRALDVGLLSRASAGELELNTSRQRIRWLIEEAVRARRPMAAGRHVQLVENLEACGQRYALIDRELFLRALDAMIENAIRFSPPHSVVTVRAEARDGLARVTVRDQGAGFAPGDGRRVFLPFTVGAGANTGGGLGLGLAVARAIVVAHGGRIHLARSRLPGGVVVMDLPLA